MSSHNKGIIIKEDSEDETIVVTNFVPPVPEERFRIFVTIEIKDTNTIKHVAVSESSRATISELKKRIELEYSKINDDLLKITSDLMLNDIFPVSDSNLVGEILTKDQQIRVIGEQTEPLYRKGHFLKKRKTIKQSLEIDIAASQMALDQFIRVSAHGKPESDSDFYPFKKDRKKHIIQLVTNASQLKRPLQKGITVAKEMILINKRLERKKPEELVGKKGVTEIHQVIKKTSKRLDDDEHSTIILKSTDEGFTPEKSLLEDVVIKK